MALLKYYHKTLYIFYQCFCKFPIHVLYMFLVFFKHVSMMFWGGPNFRFPIFREDRQPKTIIPGTCIDILMRSRARSKNLNNELQTIFVSPPFLRTPLANIHYIFPPIIYGNRLFYNYIERSDWKGIAKKIKN